MSLRTSSRGCLAAIISILGGGLAFGQTPNLAIVSPVDGTSVQPGQSFDVVVVATNAPTIGYESVVGDDYFTFSEAKPAAPQLTFSLTIPNDASPGLHYLVAMGGNHSAKLILSKRISVVVPITYLLSALRVANDPLVFDYPGQRISLDAGGITPQGFITLDSHFLTYTSDTPHVASIDARGYVTAQSQGQATVTVSYRNFSKTVSVTVKGGTRGDLNDDGRIDKDDLNLLTSWLNSQSNGPNDARDLNHDGKIDALDARILTTLCTYPRCATTP